MGVPTDSVAPWFAEPDKFFVLHVEDESTFARFEDGVYESPIKRMVTDALSHYGFPAKGIEWTLVRSKQEAIAVLAKADAERIGRGFDAVFCDLQIYETPTSDEPKEEHGFAVLEECRRLAWPCAIIVLSAFAERRTTILKREAQRREIRYDEWLHKTQDIGGENPDATKAKLRRLLLPLQRFALACLEATPPVLFVGGPMRTVLRELVVAANEPVNGWPLTRMLLVGDPGSGKGVLAQAFHHLLAECQSPTRAGLETVNCATLVTQGDGAPAALVGAEGYNATTAHAGLFERVTWYEATTGGKPHRLSQPATLANQSGIRWDLAGVAFLDEFSTLHAHSQAAVLSAVAEGVVRRAEKQTPVPIGCHVLFATSSPLEQRIDEGTAEGRLRELLQKIGRIHVPPLLSRRETVFPLTRVLAAWRMHEQSKERSPWTAAHADRIAIREGFRERLLNAIEGGQVRSVSDIKALTQVHEGEGTLTDLNLRALDQRPYAARAPKSSPPSLDESTMSTGTMLRGLDLHKHFPDPDRLSPSTREAVQLLHQKQLGGKERIWRSKSISSEIHATLVLISALLWDCPEKVDTWVNDSGGL